MNFPDILDHLSDGVQISDLSGKIVFMNQVSRERLGIKDVKSTNLLVSDFEPYFLEVQNWLDHVEDLRKKPKIVIQSKNINQQTKAEIPVEVTVRLTNFEGTDYVIAVSRDITERIQNEKLKAQKSGLQAILMEIASTYINLAPGRYEETIRNSLAKIGRFVGADRAYIFSYDFDNKTTSNTFEWCEYGISPEIGNLQNVPIGITLDWAEKHKSGQMVYVADTTLLAEPTRTLFLNQKINSFITIPLLWMNNCEGFVGFDQVNEKRVFNQNEIDLLWLFSRMITLVSNKISDQKRLQNLLTTTTEQYNRLSEYAFITSHNVRSSVANISGLVDLLKFEITDNILVDNIEKSTHQLDATLKNINDLLDYEFSHKSLTMVSCNLHSTFERVINLNKALIQAKNAKINLNVDNSYHVKGYPAYIDSILFNLFNNALVHGITEANNVIDIGATISDSNQVTILVKDNGVGLDLAKVGHKLFGIGNQFNQNKGGQGLGLFISKRQLESMNGSIDVISEPNKGCTFLVTIEGHKK